jgi:hypothetical protein
MAAARILEIVSLTPKIAPNTSERAKNVKAASIGYKNISVRRRKGRFVRKQGILSSGRRVGDRLGSCHQTGRASAHATAGPGLLPSQKLPTKKKIPLLLTALAPTPLPQRCPICGT